MTMADPGCEKCRHLWKDHVPTGPEHVQCQCGCVIGPARRDDLTDKIEELEAVLAAVKTERDEWKQALVDLSHRLGITSCFGAIEMPKAIIREFEALKAKVSSENLPGIDRFALGVTHGKEELRRRLFEVLGLAIQSIHPPDDDDYEFGTDVLSPEKFKDQ